MTTLNEINEFIAAIRQIPQQYRNSLGLALLEVADQRDELLAALEAALALSGGWREAIVELEDWCSEPVRLKNMLAAADQVDAWRSQATAVLAKAKEAEHDI